MNSLYIVFGILAVFVVSIRSYHKHSLSYGGACTSILIGILHILAGWRYAFLLIFFFVTSSKLTKMWSSIKKQKEEDFHYGGERHSKQVLSNSFIPTLISIYIVLVRSNVIKGLNVSLEYQENMLLLPTVLSYYCECCADTWGSEVGIVSSTPYLLLLPWKAVPAGTNGGISVLGMSAAVMSGVLLSILYYFIQPISSTLSFIEICEISLVSAILGTFIDSFFGSILEESWWCASQNRIVSLSQHSSKCCEVAKKENQRVQGHHPDKCGLVCGHNWCSGSEVNLLSSTLTSLIIFASLYTRYFS